MVTGRKTVIPAIGILLFLTVRTALMPAAVKLPGSITAFISYMKSYSATENNLIYYLNETLLFEPMPNFQEIRAQALKDVKKSKLRHTRILEARLTYWNSLKMTFTHKLRRIILSHEAIKEYLYNVTGHHSRGISLDLKNPQHYAVTCLLLKHAGLKLQKDSHRKFQLAEYLSPPHFEANHYYQILGFNTWNLEKNLAKTNRFNLELKEFHAHIPWDIDFLKEITQLVITPDSFAEILTRNKRFQLLLGILYRLSDEEINYINRLKPNLKAWKKIYNNDRFLCGMFILSHALRVRNNRLCLPGFPDPKAAPFWYELVGLNDLENPLKFLEQLAVRDSGKLGYFYIFTFFLPEETRKAVLFDFDYLKLREMYHLLKLDKKEKIKKLELPELREFGFFTLLYAWKSRNGAIEFPGGIESWTAALGGEKAKENNTFQLVKHLLRQSDKEESLKRFIPVYSKFFHRRELLTEEVIRTLYENYLEYDVLVDFIEKIPIREPQTVLKLFAWAKSFEQMNISKQEKETLTAVFQSLLELLAQRARTMPDFHRYDRLIEGLIQIPLSGASTYDGVFRFFHRYLDMEITPSEVDRSFLDFLLPANQDVVVHKQTYRLQAASMLKNEVLHILESQRSASLSQLAKINRLLEKLQKPSQSNPSREYREIGKQLINAFQQLPLPDEIEKGLPEELKRFLDTYSSEKLFKFLDRLISKKRDNAPQQKIDSLINKIKAGCLLQELKHYLLTCIYAVNLKHSRIQIFLNPNLVRFHDFSSHEGKNPWNYSGICETLGNTFAYHLEGGLSRLNITLAVPFSEHIFGRETGYDPIQGVPIIYNHLDLYPYPYPLSRRTYEYTGLLTGFGEELLQKSRENPALREELENELMTMTAGYRYRTIREELKKPPPKGKYHDPLLYFSEILPLAEGFFKKGTLTTNFSKKEQLEAFREPALYKAVQEEMNRLGSIYYHTFGTLKPYRYSLFPQPLSQFFRFQWTSAEMIDELKIKAAYISYLNRIPPQLLGYVIYRYLFLASDLFFRDSRIDYHRTYFLCCVFNYLYLNQFYNDFRRQGILRIK